MADKRQALLLSLLEQGIHYIEEGDAKLFLVVTKSEERDSFDFFLRTAKSEDEALVELIKNGEVVVIHRFADIFAIVPRKVRDIGKGDEESVANPRNMSMLSNGCEPSITAELKSHLIKA